MSKELSEFVDSRSAPWTPEGEETGYVENWRAAVGQVVDRHLTVSEFIVNEQYHTPRNNKIREMRDNGDIDDATWSKYTTPNPYGADRVDWGNLSYDLKANGYDVEDDSDLEARRNADLKFREAYASDIANRANFMGQVGQITGYLHAGAVDPVNIPAMLYGPIAAAKQLHLLNKIITAAKGSAAVGIATQAAAEPFMHNWHEDIGAEYTFKDSMINMALAGVIDATVSGTGVAFSEVMKKSYSGVVNSSLNRKEADQLISILEHQRSEFDVPDHMKDMDTKEYMGAIETESEYLNNPNGLNLGDVEPPTPVHNVDAEPTRMGDDIDYTKMREGSIVIEADIEGNIVSRDAREALAENDKQISTLENVIGCLRNE
jgi:hypothetical protein